MKILASLAVAGAAVLIAGTADASTRIAFGDLDLGTAAGAATFDGRVDAVAQRMCRNARRPGSLLRDRDFCQAAVRSEAFRLLPRWATVDYARARPALTL